MDQSPWIVLDETVLTAATTAEHAQHQAALRIVTGSDGPWQAGVPATAWLAVLSDASARTWLERGVPLTRSLDVGILASTAEVRDQTGLPDSAAVAVATALRLNARFLVTVKPDRYPKVSGRYPSLTVITPAAWLGPQQVSWLS